MSDPNRYLDPDGRLFFGSWMGWALVDVNFTYIRWMKRTIAYKMTDAERAIFDSVYEPRLHDMLKEQERLEQTPRGPSLWELCSPDEK